MKNLKEFYNKHKKAIIITGVVSGAVVGTYLAYKYLKKPIVSLKGKSVISWIPPKDAMDLETVKEILDLNADNASRFAIFREGPNPKDYVCIVLSDDFKYVLE